jgi:hypothetical protein
MASQRLNVETEAIGFMNDRQVCKTITEPQDVIVFSYQLEVGIVIVIVCILTSTLTKRLFLCCA